VDGNNLIGHTRELSLADPDCRRQALDRVALLCRASGSRALVVFDGGPDPHVGVQGLHLGPVQALLAGRGSDADRRILALMEQSAGQPGMTVVSSDRRLYGRARTLGLAALRIHEFNRLLAEVRGAERREAEERFELEEKSRSLEPGELEEWLRIFSSREEGDRRR
jgi:hypothetical protein